MAEQPLTIDFPAPTSEDLSTLEEAHFKAAEAKAHQESTFWAYREALDWLGFYRERYEKLNASRELRVGRRTVNILHRVAPDGSIRKRLMDITVRQLVKRKRSKSEHAFDTTNLPSFKATENPLVSILLPVYNNWHLTVQCLRSLRDHLPEAPHEIIVIDDASTDGTKELLPTIKGIRVIRNETNLGYLLTMNVGIQAARGTDYILFLNNDTLMHDDWCDALVRTASSDPTIGVVGSKLLFEDGSLQEAGGAMWSDATGFNYGRGDDPNNRSYNFVRDVDYCSGACLLVRRDLLTKLGGLDPAFAPAYYDDTDLAFSARKEGYRVVYQPASAITHLEGKSHGTDITSGTKRYQEINRHKFLKKWRTELSTHYASDSDKTRLASWPAPKGHVLVADHCIPTPDQDSGSVRITEILKLFITEGYRVTFSPAIQYHNGRYEKDLQQMGVHVLPASQDKERYLQEIGNELVFAFLCRPHPAAAYIEFVRKHAPSAKIIYDTVDLHHIRLRRQAEIEESESVHREARHMFFVELACAHKADATVVVSEEERTVLESYNINVPIFVIPNIHTVDHDSPGFKDRDGLLFVGNYNHPPNVDAALWLANEIMPRVRKLNPKVHLTLVGSNCPPKVRKLASKSKNVTVLGWIEDLPDLHRKHRYSVAPLRYGAGVKGKIGDSMARGLPTITTKYGAEGMKLVDMEDAIIVDSLSPDEFAKRIASCYDDDALWTRLSHNGIQKVDEEFSPHAVASKFDTMFSRLELEQFHAPHQLMGTR